MTYHFFECLSFCGIYVGTRYAFDGLTMMRPAKYHEEPLGDLMYAFLECLTDELHAYAYN